MTKEELTNFIADQFPEMVGGINKEYAEVIIPSDKLYALAKLLLSHPATKMDYLFCETAADRKDGLHVFYHLTSTEFGHSVMVRVILTDKENPVIPTVSDIWRAAEFYEREIFDLFGIQFQNHPDLRRIFLEDVWEGYPLRKDYKDSFTLER